MDTYTLGHSHKSQADTKRVCAKLRIVRDHKIGIKWWSVFNEKTICVEDMVQGIHVMYQLQIVAVLTFEEVFKLCHAVSESKHCRRSIHWWKNQ